MAFCVFCHKGIGPNKSYIFINTNKGVFGVDLDCKNDYIEHLHSLNIKIISEKSIIVDN